MDGKCCDFQTQAFMVHSDGSCFLNPCWMWKKTLDWFKMMAALKKIHCFGIITCFIHISAIYADCGVIQTEGDETEITTTEQFNTLINHSSHQLLWPQLSSEIENSKAIVACALTPLYFHNVDQMLLGKKMLRGRNTSTNDWTLKQYATSLDKTTSWQTDYQHAGRRQF